MFRRVFPAIAVIAVLLSGCAKLPQNAAEFRAITPGSRVLEVESFEVARPWRDVADTIRKKAPPCLAVSVATGEEMFVPEPEDPSIWDLLLGDPDAEEAEPEDTRKPSEAPLHGGPIVTYKPTVVVTEQRAELHVQMSAVRTGVPPGGAYFLVADFVAVGATTTRVDLYRGTRRFSSDDDKAIIDSVKGWADGSNLACPLFAGEPIRRTSAAPR